jgi:hypothetical protein
MSTTRTLQVSFSRRDEIPAVAIKLDSPSAKNKNPEWILINNPRCNRGLLNPTLRTLKGSFSRRDEIPAVAIKLDSPSAKNKNP